ncbi:MAG: GNAT family N-acetyltransferase [Bacteroidetes bacterium]|nr:GNAT family N-acetyltransferase [Bacteroidota bacterium]
MEQISGNILIRNFELSDYDTLIGLWTAADLPFKSKGRDTKQNIRKELQRGCASILIAELNNIAIGTVFATQDGRKGWINRLAVIPEFRKQGIGKMLVEKAESILIEKGIGIIACLIEDYNKTSLATFQKLGYNEFKGIHYLTKRIHPDI